MATANHWGGPYTFKALDVNTGQWVNASLPTAQAAIDAGKQFFKDHDPPRRTGYADKDGSQKCTVVMYSFPSIGSYRLVNHWDGGKAWNDDCNASVYDEFLIEPTNIGYDIGLNSGTCDCTDGNGAKGKPGPGSPLKRDPINVATGNKFAQETDYAAPDDHLTFRRFYNSIFAESLLANPLGAGWRHSFERELEGLDTNGGDPTVVQAYRPDGRSTQFTLYSSDHLWHADQGIQDVLTSTNDANGHPMAFSLTLVATKQVDTYYGDGRWNQTQDLGTGQLLYSTTYSDAATPITVAPKPNLLIAVTDVNGRSLHFTYDGQSRLSSVTAPDGSVVNYGFDASTSPLSSVTYPGGATMRFIYNESDKNGGVDRPWLITGVIDAKQVRYETTAYDADGRVTSMVNPNGVGAFAVNYANGSTITGPLGGKGQLYLTNQNGHVEVSGAATPCGPMCAQPWKNTNYSDGYPWERYDFSDSTNSVRTTYDSHGLLTS